MGSACVLPSPDIDASPADHATPTFAPPSGTASLPPPPPGLAAPPAVLQPPLTPELAPGHAPILHNSATPGSAETSPAAHGAPTFASLAGFATPPPLAPSLAGATSEPPPLPSADVLHIEGLAGDVWGELGTLEAPTSYRGSQVARNLGYRLAAMFATPTAAAIEKLGSKAKVHVSPASSDPTLVPAD